LERTAIVEMSNEIQRAKAFITETRKKMEALVEDFVEGKLNREQFNTLYDRYQTQINGVKSIIVASEPESWTEVLDDEETFHIRQRLMAKAIGMMIFLNKPQKSIDTLGKVSLNQTQIEPLFKQLAEKKKSVNPTATMQMFRFPQLVAEVKKIGWVFVVEGELTTIVMIFSKEPTIDQKSTVMDLLKDFERANQSHLKQPNVTADNLAMPFRVIIRRASKS
jgi:hypothetical protein